MRIARHVLVVALVALLATVAPASQREADAQSALAPCQVSSASGTTAGFPLASSALPSVGPIRVAVMFVDFSDAPSTEAPASVLARRWSAASQDYLEAASYGLLDIEIVSTNQWQRLPETSVYYDSNKVEFLRYAFGYYNAFHDLDAIDAIVVLPEITSAFTGNISVPGKVDGMDVLRGIGAIPTALIGPQTPEFDFNEADIVQDLFLHMGLRPTSGPPTIGSERSRYTGNFGFMDNPLGYQGGTFDGTPSIRNGGEPLAWQRWQLGWITNDQVDCKQGTELFSQLTGQSSRTGTKLAAVELVASEQALVVEARTRTGYDADLEREGVLVYTVGTSAAPFEIRGNYSGDFPNGSVLMQPGETMAVEGHEITVLAKTPQGYNVQIVEFGETRCNGEIVTIDMNTNGGNGAGTEGNDVILGTSSNDIIEAGGGDDTVCGGGGDDQIRGDAGSDRLIGGSGNDRMWGAQGDDFMSGGDGNDTLHGNRGKDLLEGEDGDDKIFGYADDDVIRGGTGNDRLHGNFGNDTIDGGHGDDRIFGYGDDDQMVGGFGDDLIGGNFGDDLIDGGFGNDTLYGSDGDDRIFGGFGNDLVQGNSGRDLLDGGDDNDTLDGGINADSCEGGSGFDTATRCETILGVP